MREKNGLVDDIVTHTKKFVSTSFLLEKYARVLMLIWTIAVSASLVFVIHRIKKETVEAARVQAEISFTKDLLYRRWNAKHGGVYVQVSNDSPPNPYLADIPERDISTPSGKRLTLINPAYMTRQVFEEAKRMYGIYGHITSLRPIRPENAPDPWEKEALELFERGETEAISVSSIEGKKFFRLMRPFIAESNCLKCHAKQGYREGDIRGGISVSVPMQALIAIQNRHIATLATVHAFLWIAGLGGISLGMWRIRRSERERMKAEDGIKHFAIFTDSVINSLPGIFYLLDEDGKLIRWNSNLEKVSGYNREELLKMTPSEFFAADEKNLIEENIRKVFVEGQAATEANLKSKDGQRTPYFFTGLLFPSEDKKYLLGVGIDIAERRRAEEEVKIAAEKLARSNIDLSQLTYAASHDLQEPLRVIASCVQLLSKRYREGRLAGSDDLVKYAVDGVKGMQELIKGLSDFLEIETGEMKIGTVDTSKIIEQAVNSLKPAIEESGATVTFYGLPVVMADKAQMTSLFRHLISNAIKFRDGKPPAVHISAERMQNEWVFLVHDNGIGIDPAFAERIFVMFQRLHTKERFAGIGIGLAICKKIVELHEGKIWVKSEPKKGSTFYFTIPDRERTA